MLRPDRLIPSLVDVRDRASAALFSVALAALVLQWLLLFWFVLPRLGELSFLRLHYTAGLGVDWAGPWWFAFAYPLFGLAALVANTFLAAPLARAHRGLGLAAHGTSVLVELAFTAGVVIVILLNT